MSHATGSGSVASVPSGAAGNSEAARGAGGLPLLWKHEVAETGTEWGKRL